MFRNAQFINVTVVQGVFVFIVATIAMLLFAAATQGWFLAKNRFYESIAFLLIAFTLFRPRFWMDMVSALYLEEAPAAIIRAAADIPRGQKLRIKVADLSDLGDLIQFVALLLIADGATGEEKLAAVGLTFRNEGDQMFVDDVSFGSAAANAGLDRDQEVLRVLKPVPQPNKYLMFIPALLLLGLVVFLQRGHNPRATRQTATA
jgi:hypothetical protein